MDTPQTVRITCLDGDSMSSTFTDVETGQQLRAISKATITLEAFQPARAELVFALSPIDVVVEVKTTRAEAIAERFHEIYERLAPEFGYKTREASAVPWSHVPEQNKALMIAVVSELLETP